MPAGTSAAMIYRSPEQSPTTVSNELQHYSLYHVANHNANTAFNDQLQSPVNGVYPTHSRNASTYGSPPLIQQTAQRVAFGPYLEYHQPMTMQCPDPYNNHDDAFPFNGNTYYDFPNQHGSSTSPTRHHDGAPPTPKSTASDVVRTRSSQIACRPEPSRHCKSGSGVSKVTKAYASRPKSSRTSKSAQSKAPVIDKPLSELTKDMAGIPIRDMKAWVNRTAEVRTEEVKKRNGYVTRPMNSFMLYRSAYAERTKIWCLQNNHQIVSSVSGISWPMEPEEVREQYNEYARIERANHAKAHPTYKFSPSKTPAAKKRKHDNSSDEEDDNDSVADGDAEWRPSSQRRTNAASTQRSTMEAARTAYYSPQSNYDYRPSTSEELLLPSAMSPGEFEHAQYQYGHYSMYAGLPSPSMDDMHLQTSVDATNNELYSQMPMELPFYSTDFYSSLQSSPYLPEPNLFQSQVDPSLLQAGHLSFATDHFNADQEDVVDASSGLTFADSFSSTNWGASYR